MAPARSYIWEPFLCVHELGCVLSPDYINTKHNTMKAVYKATWSCRGGDLTGVFIADADDMRRLREEDPVLNLGEVLGKHSEVCTKVSEWDLREYTSPEAVRVVEELKLSLGTNLWEEYLLFLEEEELESDTD